MKANPDLASMIADYKRHGAEYYQLERGGQVTWHGPGQLTAYLVLNLRLFEHLLVRCFVDAVLIQLAHDLLQANYPTVQVVKRGAEYPPGVWVRVHGGQVHKIGSVGCSIQHGITSYGLALNVKPDLAYLNTFEMCGSRDTRATSIYEVTGDSRALVGQTARQYAQFVSHNLGITGIDSVSVA